MGNRKAGADAANRCRVAVAAFAALGLCIASVQASTSPGARVGAAFSAGVGGFGGFESNHKVASDAAGDTVVVWEGNPTGHAADWQIYGACFDASGVSRGPAFPVNVSLPATDNSRNAQRFPAVAMNPAGNFVVVWEDYNTSSTSDEGHRIRARNFSPLCAAQDAPVDVSSAATNAYLRAPAVAMDASGNAVVSWTDSYSVRVARFNSAGIKTPAGDVTVNTAPTGREYTPSVAMDANGNFVVAWAEDTGNTTNLTDIFAQVYTSSSAAISAVGSIQGVNTYTTDVQDAPSVTITPTGKLFSIAWESVGEVGSTGQQIYARSFSFTTAPPVVTATTGEYRVDPVTSAAAYKWAPSLATELSGSFWTGWQEPDASGQGVYARWYNLATTSFDATLPLNSVTANSQVLPALATDANGDLVAGWSDQGAQGAADAVLLSRFAGHNAVDLSLGKTASAPTVTPGGSLSYTLTASNLNSASTPTGIAQIDADFGSATTVAVTDTLPSGMSYSSFNSTDPAWSCVSSNGVVGPVICQYDGVLQAGGATSVNLSVVAPSTPATITNNAAATLAQYDSNSGNNSASVAVTVGNPSAGLSPSSLSFASYALSQASPSQPVTLTNSGNVSLSISGISFTGTNPGDFSESDNCNGSVAANGGNCTINVTFTPTARGTRSASLSVASNDPSSPATIGVSGTGMDPTVGLSATSLGFGNQVVNSTSTSQSVVVTNNGNSSLTVSGITPSSGFGESDNCVALPVAASGTCTIFVTFSPTVTGPAKGSLSIVSNAPSSPDTVSLSGIGVPLAPVTLTATAGVDSVTLQWSSSTGASVYWLYKGTTSGGESATPFVKGLTGNSYTVSGLTAGQTYYFKVAAVTNAQPGPLSSEASAVPTTPSSPVTLTATAGIGSVTLQWSSSTGAGAYWLYKGTTSGGESATPFVKGLTGTSYTASGLTPGQTYYFKIAAVTNAQPGPLSGEANAAPTAPAAPTGLTATAGGTAGSVVLQWNASTGAGYYRIYQGSSPGHESPVPLSAVVTTGTSYTVTGLTSGTTYYFKVAAAINGAAGSQSGEASAAAP